MIIELDSALADLAGRRSLVFDPSGAASAADAVRHVAELVGAPHRSRICDPGGPIKIIVAVDGEIVPDPASRDLDGAERVLLFSPLAGG
ncbi:MAG: hypothetical protein CME06_11050 [Gemmatimonadetes bacterium]|nr:hypothetical protein [Gemmatimonadota bacterium]